MVHLIMEAPLSLPPPLPVAATDIVRPRFYTAGMVLALASIAGCIGFAMQKEQHEAAGAEHGTVTPNPLMEIAAKSLYGARLQLTALHQWNATMAAEVNDGLAPLEGKPEDEFRAEVVRAVMNDRWPDDTQLQSVVAKAPWLQRDLDVLRELQQRGPAMAQADWEWFRERHGWIARLARVRALPQTDPEWKAMEKDGIRTVIVVVLAELMMFTMVLGGIALLAVLGVHCWRGKVPVVLERPGSTWGGVLIEAFAIYLFGWTVLPAVLHHFTPGLTRWETLLVASSTVLLAMLWPRWRGVDKRTWTQTLGLHKGAGAWKEAGIGVLGWIGTSPLLALSLWLARWIVEKSGNGMSHPIVEPLTKPGSSQIIAVLLAVVWAPLAEETMFRGLLFPGLSALLRWVMGAVTAAFIFAVIHPQGWAAVPAIMSIALGASGLRLLRGSLIAPMALHAMNNGTLVLMLILCAS